MAKKIEEAKTQEVATTSNNLPDYLQEYVSMGNVGLENIQKDDVIMPRLAISQSMSPQVIKADPLYIPGLEVGEFFNTLTQEIYGPKVRITVLQQFPARIYFAPRGSQGPKQLCSTRILNEDGRLIEGPLNPEGCDTCEHSKFLEVPRPDGSKRPDCTKLNNYIFAIHVNGTVEPIIFSGKSKSLRPAKKLNSMLRLKQPPIPGFTMMFDLNVVSEKNQLGTYYTFNPVGAGFVSPEILKLTKEMFINFSNKEIKFDTKGIDREEEDISANSSREM